MVKKMFLIGVLGFFLAGCGYVLPVPEKIAESPSIQTPVDVIDWHELKDGFRWGGLQVTSRLMNAPKDLLVVKIDPRRYHFEIFENKDREHAQSIRDIHQEQDSLLTFNGAFFGVDFEPIGFLQSDTRLIHSLSPSDLLNAVFVLFADGKAGVFPSKDFVASEQMSFVIQNGPLILDEDRQIKILSDTGKVASRTAIGLDQEGNIILILLKQSLLNPDNVITLYQFADVLKNSKAFAEMKLHSVLNLDGGPSTGMMIGDQYYPEMEKVQHVVVVHEVKGS